MKHVSPSELSPARKAWATRRLIAAERAKTEALAKGIATPSAVAAKLETRKRSAAPVVSLHLDDHPGVGSGMRRYIVLSVDERRALLFSAPRLMSIEVDRVTFDRHAQPRSGAKSATLRAIIEANVSQADRINDHHKAAKVEYDPRQVAAALAVLERMGE